MDDPVYDIDEPLTVELCAALKSKGPYLQIRNVDSAWTSLLGLNRKLRREATPLFWRVHTFRLRPEAVSWLNASVCREIRRVLVEVIHPDRGSCSYAFKQAQLLGAVPLLLRLPSLEVIDLCIDASSLRDCIPIDREGFCEKHKTEIKESKVLSELAEGLDENHAGYLHFRIHASYEAMLRTHDKVVSEFPSLREKGNNSLNPCDNHLLGLCEKITCRLLHAIDEMCQNYCARPTMRLYFFEEAITEWNKNTSIWIPEEAQLPLVVNVMDLSGTSDDVYGLEFEDHSIPVHLLSYTS